MTTNRMGLTMPKWAALIVMFIWRVSIPIGAAIWLMVIDGNFHDGMAAGLLIATSINGAVKLWGIFK